MIRPRGFTLVEVLVALVVVAIGLTGLMLAVSGTARTSGYLRDKTLAQWIALNRIAEVRLTVNKLAQSASPVAGLSGGASSGTAGGSNGDAAELKFAGRTWHYDTRYYDTTFQSTKRIVVRVWAGDAKTKSNPVAEATGFYGSFLSTPGNSNSLDWTQGSTAVPCAPAGTATATAGGTVGAVGSGTPGAASGATVNCTPAATGGAPTSPGTSGTRTPTPAPASGTLVP